jgi:hypothetical protein
LWLRKGVKGSRSCRGLAREEDARLSVDAHTSLVVLAAGLQMVQTMIGSIDKRIIVQHRSNGASQRLKTISGDRHSVSNRHRRHRRGSEGFSIGS